MAKTKKIERFLTKQLDEMIDNLDAFCISSDNEKLHDLRLNAKKTRAVISMVNDCRNNKKKFSIKKLKELFDHAGEIRTAQLNVGTLHENNIPNESLENDQNQILKRESEELCQRKKTYSKDIKKLQKRISSHSFRIKGTKIIGYYHTGIEQLMSNFSRPIKEEVLHDHRKLIKKLLLALKALPGSLQNEININREYLDDLQDKIGKWHDIEITTGLVPDQQAGYQSLYEKKQGQLQAIKNLVSDFNEKVAQKEGVAETS